METISVSLGTLPRVKKSGQMRDAEDAHGGRDLRLIIGESLKSNNMKWSKVADELGVPRSTLHKWARNLGIRIHVEVRLS